MAALQYLLEEKVIGNLDVAPVIAAQGGIPRFHAKMIVEIAREFMPGKKQPAPEGKNKTAGSGIEQGPWKSKGPALEWKRARIKPAGGAVRIGSRARRRP